MATSYKPEELSARYGKSEHGNFSIKNTIGVPHPYMITVAHVKEAADHHGGMLGTSAIEAAEKKRIFCGICKGQLKVHQHETALVVSCKQELKINGEVNPELHAYLVSVTDKVNEDKFAGFAFVRN
jgi:hypothetical protein